MKNITYSETDNTTSISISGKSELDLYKYSLAGMAKVLVEPDFDMAKATRIKRSIEVRSNFPAQRLEEFLRQILHVSYEDHAVFNEMAIEVLSKDDIRAIIFGIKVNKYDRRIHSSTLSVKDFGAAGSRSWEASIDYNLLSD